MAEFCLIIFGIFLISVFGANNLFSVNNKLFAPNNFVGAKTTFGAKKICWRQHVSGTKDLLASFFVANNCFGAKSFEGLLTFLGR